MQNVGKGFSRMGSFKGILLFAYFVLTDCLPLESSYNGHDVGTFKPNQTDRNGTKNMFKKEMELFNLLTMLPQNIDDCAWQKYAIYGSIIFFCLIVLAYVFSCKLNQKMKSRKFLNGIIPKVEEMEMETTQYWDDNAVLENERKV